MAMINFRICFALLILLFVAACLMAGPALAQEPTPATATVPVGTGVECPVVAGSDGKAEAVCASSVTSLLRATATIGRAPTNEVVIKPLLYGVTYEGKAADLRILPHDSKGLWIAVTPKVSADFAIIEVLYRETVLIQDRERRLFRTKTQVIRADMGASWILDPIDLKLEDIEKINVRLVSESSVVEFWSDVSEVQAIRQRPIEVKR